MDLLLLLGVPPPPGAPETPRARAASLVGSMGLIPAAPGLGGTDETPLAPAAGPGPAPAAAEEVRPIME